MAYIFKNIFLCLVNGNNYNGGETACDTIYIKFIKLHNSIYEL